MGESYRDYGRSHKVEHERGEPVQWKGVQPQGWRKGRRKSTAQRGNRRRLWKLDGHSDRA